MSRFGRLLLLAAGLLVLVATGCTSEAAGQPTITLAAKGPADLDSAEKNAR